MTDRVTLESAEDYGRRCASIGKERHNTADLQDAMGNPNFKAEHHALLDRLANEQRQRKPFMNRPAWMTIKLGTQKKVAGLRKAILDTGDRISDWGDDILKRTAVAGKPTEVELFRATVAEIGFPSGGTWAQIRTKLDEFGFGNCPAEVGQQLRLQYTDQPNGEWLWVVMGPITDSDGSLRVFCVGRVRGARWLGGFRGLPDGVLCGDVGLVFRRK